MTGRTTYSIWENGKRLGPARPTIKEALAACRNDESIDARSPQSVAPAENCLAALRKAKTDMLYAAF